MDLDSLIVEVRNSSLERVGIILQKDLRLDAEIPHNTVGQWTVNIAQDHPLTAALSAPGGGLVVTDASTGETVFSGPAVSPEEAQSPEDVGGTVTVRGVTDMTVLADALSWPEPANGNITTQTVDKDERTGPAETLMHGYVNANIGPGGSAERKNPRLKMGENIGRGATATMTARFDTLLSLMQSIAKPDGLGFRVVQVDSNLYFETFLPLDNSRKVRLSIENDGLASARLVQSAPGVTRAIVAGKGGATTRLFLEVTNEASLAAEAAWGRRIERFVDEQSSRNTDELTRSGDAALAEDGFTGSNARFEPTASFRGTFGKDWNLGDRVSIESNGKEYLAPVAALILKVDEDGLRVGALLGDPSTFGGYALQSRIEEALAPPVPPDDSAHDPTWNEELEAALAANDATQAQLALDLAANDEVQAQLVLDLAANDVIQDQLVLDLAANDLALEAIGTTANGKNSVRYMTVAPTNEANTAGDIWYVRAVAAGSPITAQYEGLGGTSWTSRSLTNVVVTNLDAGAITTGSLAAARIAATALNANNITAGTLNAGIVAVTNLSASVITTGTLNASLVAVTNLSATNITTGTLNASVVNVTNLSATNITTGTLNAARINGLTINALTLTGATITGGSIDIGSGDFTVSSLGVLRTGNNAYFDGGVTASTMISNGTVSAAQGMTSTGYGGAPALDAFYGVRIAGAGSLSHALKITSGGADVAGGLNVSGGVVIAGTNQFNSMSGTTGNRYVYVDNNGTIQRGAAYP